MAPGEDKFTIKSVESYDEAPKAVSDGFEEKKDMVESQTESQIDGGSSQVPREEYLQSAPDQFDIED